MDIFGGPEGGANVVFNGGNSGRTEWMGFVILSDLGGLGVGRSGRSLGGNGKGKEPLRPGTAGSALEKRDLPLLGVWRVCGLSMVTVDKVGLGRQRQRARSTDAE